MNVENAIQEDRSARYWEEDSKIDCPGLIKSGVDIQNVGKPNIHRKITSDSPMFAYFGINITRKRTRT
jgi:hypothetical protein